MLQGAAATDTKMRTDRRAAFGTGNVYLDQVAAIGMSGPLRNFDGLVRQRVRHIDGAGRRISDAVPHGSHARNRELFTHGSRRSKNPGCSPPPALPEGRARA